MCACTRCPVPLPLRPLAILIYIKLLSTHYARRFQCFCAKIETVKAEFSILKGIKK